MIRLMLLLIMKNQDTLSPLWLYERLHVLYLSEKKFIWMINDLLLRFYGICFSTLHCGL